MADNEESTAVHILQVEGVWLPGIREYNVTLEDLDSENSKRTEDGTMHREILRPNVYHANVTHIVKETDMITICEAVKADAVVEVTALCPGKGETPSSTFDAYVSKLNTQLILHETQAGALESWWQIDYQLVEV